MIGDKIRRQREKLGMSQSDLADGKITRAYISLIESGKRVPSRNVLNKIAAKLNRPPQYFLHNLDEESKIDHLLQSAKWSYQNQDFHHSYLLARQAYSAAIRGDNTSQVIDSRVQSALSLFKLGKMNSARESLLDALLNGYAVHDYDRITSIFFHLGNVCYRLESYREAMRYYLKVISYTKNHKPWQTFYIESLIYLGSCLFRMERYKSAIAAYQKAYKISRIANLEDEILDASLGLGSALYKYGATQQALQIAEDALSFSDSNHDYRRVELLHNMAIYNATLERKERALHMLDECLHTYVENQDKQGQADVLEEKAKIYIDKGNLGSAEDQVREALKLLDIYNNSALKAQLYVHLGTIYSCYGDREQAKGYYKLAMDSFRRINLSAKVEWVKQMLDTL